MSREKDNIVDLKAYRDKKSLDDELGNGRKPLYLSHLDGKLRGSPHFNRPGNEDFGDRLQRIRTSLEKINRLMGELKKISKEEKKEKVSGVTSIFSKN